MSRIEVLGGRDRVGVGLRNGEERIGKHSIYVAGERNKDKCNHCSLREK